MAHQAGASAQAPARDTLSHGLAVGMTIYGIASHVGAAVTLLLVREDTARVAAWGDAGAGGR
ncbi:hypothetical protein ABT009_29070 [Streptomyces sp. NPDC002896]|uniref:hypothetical protein n=1 Tax=Streptomyces sp. NPDC002896 TaxID=3154438 RepID=UPI00331A33E1